LRPENAALPFVGALRQDYGRRPSKHRWRTNVRGGVIGLSLLLAGLPCHAFADTPRDFRVTVLNSTDAPLEYFYFSACGTNKWGQDRLGKREVVHPGGKRTFDMRDGGTECCRDMRVTLSTGASRQKLGVDVCREREWIVR
jgi:hypothetical protein